MTTTEVSVHTDPNPEYAYGLWLIIKDTQAMVDERIAAKASKGGCDVKVELDGVQREFTMAEFKQRLGFT